MNAMLDLAGIGIGPFNLSIAALADRQRLDTRFYDAKPAFDWHPGMMLPEASMQTSCLKDLVTPVDPTHPLSFLNYLVAHQRFYSFMNADQAAVSRQEFGDYLRWAASQLNSLRFGSRVREVRFDNDRFRIRHDQGSQAAANICVGVGKQPFYPANSGRHAGARCFHAIDMQRAPRNLAGRRVTVIGGGQSGAEIVLHALQGHWGSPARISWISRRENFLPLDESPFTNEFFSPAYVDSFRQLSDCERRRTVDSQKLASDGISIDTLRALYQAIYRRVHVEGDAGAVACLPGRELTDLQGGGDFCVTTRHRQTGATEVLHSDYVILCTGFVSRLPDCLIPLAERMTLDPAGLPKLGAHFEARWDGPAARRIFMVNAGRYSHGIAEPQLSLMAWRAARVVNALLGRRVYQAEDGPGLIDWHRATAARAVA